MSIYSCRAQNCEVIETAVRAWQHRGLPIQDLRLYPHWPQRAAAHVDMQFDCEHPLDVLLAELANQLNGRTMFDTLRALPAPANPMTPAVRTPRDLITRAELDRLAQAAADMLPAPPGRVTPLSDRTVINLASMALAAWRNDDEDLPRKELERLQSIRESEDVPSWGVFLAPDEALKLVRMALRLHDQAA